MPYCGQCGGEVGAADVFCRSCGARHDPDARAVEQPATLSAPAPPDLPSAAGESQIAWVLKVCLAQLRQHPGTVLRNAFSFRLMFAAFLIAAVPGVIGSLIHPVVGSVLFFATFVVAWLLSAANPLVAMYCPHCAKRVKTGAASCHHCGRAVAASVA